MRVQLAVSGLFLLAACGGGGGGTALPGPQEFTEIVQEHRALELAAADAPTTSTSVTPPAIPATFDGFIVLDTQPGATRGQLYYSRITLAVDFAAESLSTAAGGDDFWFFDEVAGGPDGTRVDGAINVSSTEVQLDDPLTLADSFPLTISGNLAIDGGALLDVDSVATSVSATFAGDEGAGGEATNVRFFAAGRSGEETVFTGGPSIPTRIIAEIQ